MDDESQSTETPQRQWEDWPLCPDCGRRRQAICPTCQFAADEMPLADFLEPVELVEIALAGAEDADATPRDSIERILLMCPQCEEVFAPRFYEQCAWCGHGAEDGVRQPDDSLGEFTPRVLWTLIALLVGAGGLLGYFVWVMAD